jgi:hypothetical protein
VKKEDVTIAARTSRNAIAADRFRYGERSLGNFQCFSRDFNRFECFVKEISKRAICARILGTVHFIVI